MKYSNNNYQRCWQAMSARWYPVRIKAKPQLLSSSPTSIITVITSSSYGIASLSTHLGVIRNEVSRYKRSEISSIKFSLKSVNKGAAAIL
jgi:hypothetical protein